MVLNIVLISLLGLAIVPSDIKVYRNLDYVQGVDYPKDKDKLDIFMPAGAEKAPTLLVFHGGALMRGDKSEQQFVPECFVPEGFGVVVANYRLSPDVMHPAHIQDAAAAFAWVTKNIAKYGGDPERIYVAGHSAGAYLALLVALDPSYLRVHSLDPSAIRAVLAVSPFTWVEEVAKERDKSVWGTDPEVWKQASLRPYIGRRKPPVLAVYADGDEEWRKRHNKELVELLSAAGNTAKAVEVPNRDHGSVWRGITAADDQTAKHMVAFMRAP